jgi:prevent-host-death family protein
MYILYTLIDFPIIDPSHTGHPAMISNTGKPSKKAGSGKSAPSPTRSRNLRTGRKPRHGHAPVTSVSSTTAKTSFRDLIQKAKRGPVFVTVHKKLEAVVMSVDEYEQLLANQRDPLADMTGHFDALVAKMQTAEHAAAVDALFKATPEELGDAAVQAAKHD